MSDIVEETMATWSEKWTNIIQKHLEEIGATDRKSVV